MLLHIRRDWTSGLNTHSLLLIYRQLHPQRVMFWQRKWFVSLVNHHRGFFKLENGFTVLFLAKDESVCERCLVALGVHKHSKQPKQPGMQNIVLPGSIKYLHQPYICGCILGVPNKVDPQALIKKSFQSLIVHNVTGWLKTIKINVR